MKNKHIELMERVIQYLQLHNRPLYLEFNTMLNEIKEEKVKRNAYRLKQITEKRKIDPTYGGHKKKVSIGKDEKENN